jgi:CheY-like chemotaxis protein
MKIDPKDEIKRPADDLNRELRTGLNDILGFASLLESHANAKDRETVQQILSSGRQMLDLIGGTLPQIAGYPVNPTPPPVPAQKNILYVEDNNANYTLVSRILEMRPVANLIRAECGQTGVELATKIKPQLILLDLHLPDIPGAEVLRQLRAQSGTASIPVVVISADATPSQIERLLSAGARNYLTKPYSMEMLLAVIDDVLADQAR